MALRYAEAPRKTKLVAKTVTPTGFKAACSSTNLSLHEHYRLGGVPVNPRHPGEPHEVLVFPGPEQSAQLDRIQPPLRVSRGGHENCIPFSRPSKLLQVGKSLAVSKGVGKMLVAGAPLGVQV